VHPEDAPAAGAAWAAAVRDGAPYEVEYRFRRHDGAYRWFVGRGLPYRDPATGETACWVGVCAAIDLPLVNRPLEVWRVHGEVSERDVIAAVRLVEAHGVAIHAAWERIQPGPHPEVGQG
jgi:hypothetical protein